MKTLTGMFTMAAVLVLVAMNAVAGEAKWWEHEYTGIGDPTAATPAWGASGSVSGSQGPGYWIQATDAKWTGYTQATAMPGGGSTVEVRFRYNGNAQEGLLFQNQPHQFQAPIQDAGGDGDLLVLNNTGGGSYGLDEEWNIVRFLYQGNHATVYTLPGGEMAHNQGLWANENLDPVNTNWAGAGAGGGTYWQIGGEMDIDYIRWTDNGNFAPEGVPEPTSLILLGVGGLVLLRRRRG